MVRICKISKDKVLQQIHEKEIKGIIQSRTDLIDDIILSMNKEGVLECLSDGIPDRRNQQHYRSASYIIDISYCSQDERKNECY